MKINKIDLYEKVPQKDVVAAFFCVALLVFSLIVIHVFDFKYLSAIKANSYLEILILLGLGEIFIVFYKLIRRQ